MLHWRQSSGARLPLLLMNSYNTSAQSLAALSAYDTLGTPGLPLEFLQSKTPKIEVDSETYEVRADGELLTCAPAEVLPMAQRYFMY